MFNYYMKLVGINKFGCNWHAVFKFDGLLMYIGCCCCCCCESCVQNFSPIKYSCMYSQAIQLDFSSWKLQELTVFYQRLYDGFHEHVAYSNSSSNSLCNHMVKNDQKLVSVYMQ